MKPGLWRVADARPLGRWLAEALPAASRTALKGWLTHGCIAVNGRIVTRHDHPLVVGDEVELLERGGVAPLRHPQLRILHADRDMIAVDKGAGLLAVATATEERHTAYRILRDHLQRSDPSARLYIVHRLDRDTSGVLLFARTPEVQHRLQHEWNERVAERCYAAVVEGTPPADEGRLTWPLEENRAGVVYVARPGEGVEAVTDYRLIRQRAGRSLLEVRLHTGRKNQIRVHLARLGCPVVGDRKYGSGPGGAPRMLLHARRIVVRHPVTGREIEIEAPVPRIFEDFF